MDKITDLSVYSANKKIKRGEKNTNSYLAKKKPILVMNTQQAA
jgi:hypothetical protein